MRTLAFLTGTTLGITATWAWGRYAGTILWWLFALGDTPKMPGQR